MNARRALSLEAYAHESTSPRSLPGASREGEFGGVLSRRWSRHAELGVAGREREVDRPVARAGLGGVVTLLSSGTLVEQERIDGALPAPPGGRPFRPPRHEDGGHGQWPLR